MPLHEYLEAAKAAAAEIESDVFFYNGEIVSGPDLNCIREVFKTRKAENALLFLTTNGGNPDAGYRLARYFQERYQNFTVVVSGLCKSAGTLIALGAHELAFTPYGELGPLDIQHSKVDKVGQSQSGLTIQDALMTLEQKATERFQDMVRSYVQANDGLLSFDSATKAASSFVTQLYAPVLARIDPEEVGDRHRSMRIADDYGKRLAIKSRNLKDRTLQALIETYPSHSFVIDEQEAATLFNRVRSVTDKDIAIIEALGPWSRFVMTRGMNVEFHTLHRPADAIGEASDADADLPGDRDEDVGNSQGAAGETGVPNGVVAANDADERSVSASSLSDARVASRD